MPATAGRVRMPANNRVHSSAALQTHGIWQSAIGYDPYAPNKDDKDSSQNVPDANPDAENAYASFQGLLQLAKITNADVDISRGACKKCGRVGHLKFQCKNYVNIKDDTEEKDGEAMQLQGLVGLDKKLKGKAKVNRGNNVESSEEEDEDEDSESSDSEVDSEIERIIAERSGKKISRKGGFSRKKRDSDDDGSEEDSAKKRKKRGRSKKRSGKREVSDSHDSGERRRRKRRRQHRRRRDKSSDEDDEYRRRRRKSRKEKRRRRSRRSDSDSETSEDSDIQHKRMSKRVSLSSSDSDSSGYIDSRVGRDVKKSGKRRHHHRDHELSDKN